MLCVVGMTGSIRWLVLPRGSTGGSCIAVALLWLCVMAESVRQSKKGSGMLQAASAAWVQVPPDRPFLPRPGVNRTTQVEIHQDTPGDVESTI